MLTPAETLALCERGIIVLCKGDCPPCTCHPVGSWAEIGAAMARLRQ